jgi:L-fuconolactonase
MNDPVIDTHLHFWDLGRFQYPWMTPARASLRRNYLPEDAKPLLAAAHVDQGVVVQAHHSLAESRWLLELAATHDFLAGAVVWVDLTSPAVGKDLDDLQRHPKFKGIRHIVEDEPDDAWLLRPVVLAGLAELERRDIPYDLLVHPRHLQYIPALRDRCPRLRFVVDHIAKPRIREKQFDDWAREMEAVAALPQMWCKLSGMITEADGKNWTAADLRPYVDHVVKIFGYDRVMFGSDWPVCTLAGSYQQVVDALREALGPLAPANASRVWGATAREFYQLA